jgi:hypothetical protein
MVQRRATFTAPSLPEYVGQRAETVEWEVLAADNSPVGTVAPLEIASINNNIGNDIIRAADGLKLSQADCAEMNMLTTRLRPVWLMDDGSRWPLGVFMFSGADQHPRKRTSESTRTMSMYDQNTLLLDKRREAFGVTKGTSVRTPMIQLVEEARIPVYEVSPTSAVAGADMGWPAGTTRLAILRHLCAISGMLRPYFDNEGKLVIRNSPDLESHEPDISYDTGPSSRIHVDSMVIAQDLFDAPNIFLVTSSGANDSEISAYALVPATMPHSVQNTGREKVETIELQGFADSEMGFAVAAAAAAQRVDDFFLMDFEGAPDPRHDTFQIIAVDGVNYREVSWDLSCQRGGPHTHHLCLAYSLVQNPNDTAPSGVGAIAP